MTRSLHVCSLAGFVVLGLAPVLSAASDAVDQGDLSRVPVAVPYALEIRERAWNGDPHAMSRGRAELTASGEAVWTLPDVMLAVASADGSAVALLTSDHQVHVSRLPEQPRRIEGGPYLSPALSEDGTLLVAQRLGSEGHILEKTHNTRGIALIDLTSGDDRLLLEGNDLYAPAFAAARMLFFGSGGKEQIASLYLLDLDRMSVARVTNREHGSRQTFPSQAPQLAGGTISYRADDEFYRVAVPGADDFVPVERFDAPQPEASEGVSPNVGSVRIRRPSTQTNVIPKIYQYFDQNQQLGPIDDWTCGNWTYDQHQGTDFKQNYGKDVVAPASGQVYRRYDGCPDTNVPGCGLGFGNYAGIEHADLGVSLEAHGKKWTVVENDTWLACGDKVMESASSGNSNAYHIHHESWVDRTAGANKNLRYDPYKGTCDPSDPSKWSVQNGYKGLPGDLCTH